MTPRLPAALLVAAALASTGARADAPGAADLEAFADGYFAAAMADYRVPGLVFVAVKDGAVLLAKGYGVADLESGRPVDPERTLFRVASVSKLVTATAVMQLVERGRLDPHRDVNAYLEGWQLRDTFPQPVTALHLLTHTAGFDERLFGMSARTPEEVRPLAEYLPERMPRRVMPPGEAVSYSNHGYALAGLLVETISGEPFDAYVRKHVLEPLGMTRSTFSLRPDLAPDLAQGYLRLGDELRSVPLDHLETLASAGGLMTTGTDLARFMLAHLQGGRLGEVRILSEITTRLMHAQQYTHHPRLPGFAYGFMEDFVNGRRLVEHGGGWPGFSSLLLLDPEADFAFFASFNLLSLDAREAMLHADFVHALYDRYFPAAEEPAPEPPPDFAERAGRYAGSYRHNRYERHSFGKLMALVSEYQVTAEADGALVVDPPGAFLPRIRLVEVEPQVFLRDDGRGYAVFRADEDGRVRNLYLQTYAPSALDRIGVLESARVNLAGLGIFLSLALSALVGWPLARALRGPRPHPPAARAARWIAAAACGLFLAAAALVVVEIVTAPLDYLYSVPTRTRALLRLSYLTAGLFLATPVFTALAWRRRWWTLGTRLHYSAISVASLGMVAFMRYWNLFGVGD